jgi:hypothetical protein
MGNLASKSLRWCFSGRRWKTWAGVLLGITVVTAAMIAKNLEQRTTVDIHRYGWPLTSHIHRDIGPALVMNESGVCSTAWIVKRSTKPLNLVCNLFVAIVLIAVTGLSSYRLVSMGLRVTFRQFVVATSATAVLTLWMNKQPTFPVNLAGEVEAADIAILLATCVIFYWLSWYVLGASELFVKRLFAACLAIMPEPSLYRRFLPDDLSSGLVHQLASSATVLHMDEAPFNETALVEFVNRAANQRP